MCDYKELFYDSQAEIANAIDSFDDILKALKKEDKKCEYCDYKNLLYKSQLQIANVILELDHTIESLTKCMQECEEKILSNEEKIKKLSEEEDFISSIIKKFKRLMKKIKITMKKIHENATIGQISNIFFLCVLANSKCQIISDF